jgi:hypothetical protein
VKIFKGILFNILKSKIGFGTILVLSITMTTSCQYKNAEEAYPINLKDTAGGVSYSKYIQPLLKTNCYSCHTAAVTQALGGGYVLDNYNDVATRAQVGDLYNDLNDPDVNSIRHMPRSQPSLPPADIIKVKAWIDQGSKNN